MKNAKRHLTCGTCILALLVGLVATPSAQAQTFTTLLSFNNIDGAIPFAALVQGTDGNLYGTTEDGGTNDDGTVFKITPGGTLTTLHSFDLTDGDSPFAGLVQATDGNFYGTTLGGANGGGTVFKITPSGTLTTLYSFCSQSGCADGEAPWGLVQAADGNFYGTTEYGGTSGSCPPFGCGTVFKITPGGTLTALYSFCSQSGCTDGNQPYNAALIQATGGSFYGTTSAGGANREGTIFKITPRGALTTLYNFCSQAHCGDGAGPSGPLLQFNGNFYGTTLFGGAHGTFNSGGTVFKIASRGSLITLYSFCSQSGCADGQEPEAALVQATDGNLYGITDRGGGAFNGGTVFKITPAGVLTTLYRFCSQSGCADGTNPTAGLVQDTSGTLYGTTVLGGTIHACGSACGTLFSLAVGLGPFVQTMPTLGKVGKIVKILGTNLTGATSVTFNGTAATFTVVSKSLITTTVPTGATTGTVQVVTPSGTLSSNVPFRVLP